MSLDDPNDPRTVLLDIALEGLRLGQRFERALGKLDLEEARPFVGQVHFHRKRVNEALEAAGFRLVSVQGQAYDPGMPLTGLNIADFEPGARLVVCQMLEPIVMGPDGVERAGVAMLEERSQ